ncbi:hypothetical protein ABVK25_006658 [Lepraria finkii]|uniref:Amidase domain-containing protein n=1 Tax=Lepraria finkii TaxID=1340010 RepID=A0ABR4B578_9LECA
MLRTSLLVGLVYVSSHVLAASLSDHVTYQCSGKSLLPGLPRLDEASVDDLNILQASGAVTSVDYKTYIERINEVNPLLRAVSERNLSALLIASSLDAERAAGRVRGPLHGILILIKGNIATQDLTNNTAGSYAFLGATVTRESTVISRPRTPGAVFLGKATMGEWAQMRS